MRDCLGWEHGWDEVKSSTVRLLGSSSRLPNRLYFRNVQFLLQGEQEISIALCKSFHLDSTMISQSSAEFFKYRRKWSVMEMWLALLLLLVSSDLPTSFADEAAGPVYQCNNQTQTCVTEAEQQQQSDQQFNIAASVSSQIDTSQQSCRGKVILSQSNGFLSDGPGNYSLDAKCTWVIQSSIPNATIRCVF